MNRAVISLGLSLILLVSPSCSRNENTKSQEMPTEDTPYSPSEIQEANDLAMPVSQLRKLSKETRQKRAASIILSDYVVLKDNQYQLEITKQEARKLGIATSIYEIIKQDIANTNAIIKQALENGDTIELPDIQAISKAYKNK